MKSSFILCLFFLIGIIELNAQGGSNCFNHQKCDSCLLSDFSCSWCSDREYGMMKARCMSKKDLISSGCRSEYIQINEDNLMKITENNNLRDFFKDNMDAIQIQPQKAKLKLRKSQPQTITMKYKPAKNYPLDLYYLMDLTLTMLDDRDTLKNMGEHLAAALVDLTENYRLAFGSFADKPAMPFISMGHKDNPCSPTKGFCQPSYAFWHRLSFTSNTTEFLYQVGLNDITANLDKLEGGFDAVMQIAVCGPKIGWSENARKMILFASDGDIHFAGDGILAGIVQKAEKKCHIGDDGQYTASLIYDYPSLEEIYRILIEKKINLIFAAESQVINIYDSVHGLMQEMTSVGVLENDSSNILELIKQGYMDFVRRVQFIDNSPEYISIKYKTNCGKHSQNLKAQSKCDNIEIGKEYEFLIEITLLDYPSDEKYQNIIKIEESSLSSEGLELDIEIEKPCTCLSEEIAEKESELCNSNGELKCGACYCDPGWIGKTCSCDLQDYSTGKDLENLCRESSINTSMDSFSPICSNKGDCVCGECQCFFGYSGRFCNCLDCPKLQDQECGGSKHATCNCGICDCETGWTGDFCECTSETNTCMSPNNKICSGKGKCVCGQCECDNNFYGQFCQISTDQKDVLCSYYEPCVKCMILRREGRTCDDISKLCRSSEGSEFIAEYFQEIPGSNEKCIIRMTKEDGKTCEHTFDYRLDSYFKSQLRIVHNKCKRINFSFYGLGIALAILLLGLGVLIFGKITVTIKDRREYVRFEKEREQNTLYNGQSPLYKSPVTRYEIPKMDDDEFEML